MKKNHLFSALPSLLAAASFILTGCASSSKQTTVAIVVPMDHSALREIVHGFETTLQKDHEGEFKIIVKNAHGEASMQKTILQQLIGQKVDLLVPIGLSATQMSAHMTHEIPIVSLGAKINASERPDNLTGLNDELPPSLFLNFAQKVIPNLKELTLIHSPSEKIFPEVQLITQLCESLNIKVQALMIQNMSDLYPIAQSINPQSQLILILKDHMVVSAIATLSQTAQKLGIPLMASDDGSVSQGASFAIGVKESDTGIEGAKLALKVLGGTKPKEIEMQNMESIHVFINKTACEHQSITPTQVEKAAQEEHFNLIYVE